MPQDQKHTLRATAIDRRGQQPNRDRFSLAIVASLTDLPEYCRAVTPVLYVDVRDEVRTQSLIAEQLASGRSVIVPYCRDNDLRLCRVDQLSELTQGAYGILEPTDVLRDNATRRIEPAAVDLIVIPGVAFDRRGHRLGHGFGYYDRLLARLADSTTLVALAFDCQVFDNVPHEPHDVAVDIIVTESTVYRI